MRRRNIIFIVLLAMAGCDKVSGDRDVQPQETITFNMVTASNRSTVIDLKDIIQNVKSISSLDGTNVELIGNRYVKYNASSSTSQKSFTFHAKRIDGTVVAGVVNTQNQSTGDNCTANLPFTYAKISNKEVLVVNVLNNPEFCGYNLLSRDGIAVSISGDEIPQEEDVVISTFGGGSSAGIPNAVILTYRPSKGFVGRIKGKYYARTNDFDPAKPGSFFDPSTAQFYSAHEFIVDVTDL